MSPEAGGAPVRQETRPARAGDAAGRAERGARPVTARALCRLLRARTSAGAAVLTAAGWWTLMGRPDRAELSGLLAMAAAAVGFIAFAQVYNDIRDLELDRAGKPWRPLPSGQVSLGAARGLAAALAAGSLAAASVAGAGVLLVCAGCLLLGVLYSLRLKDSVLLGNAVVALVSSSGYLLPAVAAWRITPPVLLGQALVFFFILGNEFYKTAEDAGCDGRHGVRTLGTVFRPPAVLAALGCCWALLLATVAACAVAGAGAFALVGAVTILLPAGYGVLASSRAVDDAGALAAAGHRWWRLAWALGLPSLLLLR